MGAVKMLMTAAIVVWLALTIGKFLGEQSKAATAAITAATSK